ncbi:MAG: RagB/SusD family nutrient uptake outer membrane protein, partial [Sphingobacteriales bacterium]
LIYILGIFATLMFFSCKKYLTVAPEGYIPAEENFKTADDAVSSIHGLYALMQPLVDQIFLAGEAQADMVIAARGADKHLAEIAQNRVTAENPYTDYTNFYKLIVACNNTLAGLDQLVRVDPVNYSADRYTYNAAEVVYIRLWAYLQMVKIWGDVPYVDASITSVADLKSLPAMKQEEILARLEAEALKYYATMLTASPTTSAVGGNIAGSEIRTFRGQMNNFAAQCLLSEIYVYRGNYAKAKDILGALVPFGNASSGNVGVFGMTAYDYNNYDKLFISVPTGDANDGRAFYIDFDGAKGQTNNLQSWTNNNIRNGGVYALKPSSNALKNWREAQNMLLNYQNTAAGYYIDMTKTGGDANPILNSSGEPVKGGNGDYVRGEGISYQPSGNDTLIFKYLLKTRGKIKDLQQNDNNSNNDAMFIVYRDGPMYLLACEIFNHMGLSHQALAMLNGGIGSNGYKGVRWRARLVPLKLDPNGGDVVKQVDMMILNERALEAGFEGLRWFDLVRMSKRYGPALIADIVAQKYPSAEQAAIKTRLMDPNKWYFPYYKRNLANNDLLVQKPGF